MSSEQPSSLPSLLHSSSPSEKPSSVPSSQPIGVMPSGPSWESLVLSSVTDNWQTVQLSATFTAPVVVCSVQYNGGITLPPAVVRLSNVGSNSFDIRLQNPGDLVPISSGRPVHCVCAEEGVWELPDGRVVEARTFTSSTTANRNNWRSLTQQTLTFGFSDLVVLGQVMTFNDSAWSAFITTGNRRQTSPNVSSFYVGKHTGEDLSSRVNEVVGYIVIEGGIHGAFGSNTEFEADLGADSVGGFVSGSYQYNFLSSFTSPPEVVVVSQNGVDGGHGSWAVLTSSATASSFGLAVDEDQVRDNERTHGTEEVSYVAISNSGVVQLSAVSR